MYEHVRTYDCVLRIIINTIRIYGEGSKFTMATLKCMRFDLLSDPGRPQGPEGYGYGYDKVHVQT